MAARGCKGLILTTAALLASRAASRDRCFCCDAFIPPTFRASIAVVPATAGRLGRQHRRRAAPAVADADADASPSAAVNVSEEAPTLEGGSLDVENVVVIGRCAEDLNDGSCVFVLCVVRCASL